MTSPPATPPPDSQGEQRFEQIYELCEWPEDYRPGGFHPINLGDTFRDGKYKVIRKLGEGSFSTACRPKYVALKVTEAESSTACTELTILDHLSKVAHKDPNSRHTMQLLDSFRHKGPNGIHQCLVFEPMGGSAASLVEELPENNPKMYGIPQRYPKRMAKIILLHALRGLSFLHQNSIVHGDFQPGNLLFSINSIDEVEQQHLEQDEAHTAVPLLRLDGKTDRWAPTKLYVRQSLHHHAQLGLDLCVKISDFGAAFRTGSPPPKPVTPRALRAPELILKQDFDSGIDIWSFGCLMYEFLTGEVLFAVMMIGRTQQDRDDADDDHLIQMHNIIRPLSSLIMGAWPRASTWFDSEGKPVQQDGGDETEEENGSGIYVYDTLEQRFAKRKHPDIDDEEAAVICQLIREILVYDPAERPSAAELLKHPWFSE
ncbi:hypothetical protein EKO04_000677 [Ascochyta lentis]|uniref:non-specific serine/threonine protein kinase n=1 Tax=Ascochyta lentis TaxID=205686 RepID=A0A8H7JEU9_9PLEO|nr:hypothetical protein EKO04_000677 [Ascochyta lentis]